jgi:membrane-bound lytic murein transglycosylase B
VRNSALKGPAYLVHENFRTVMQYNKSYKYALTVLQMSDALDARRPAPAVTMPAPDPYNQ